MLGLKGQIYAASQKFGGMELKAYLLASCALSYTLCGHEIRKLDRQVTSLPSRMMTGVRSGNGMKHCMRM